jgi:hypothetical protein
VKVSCAESEAHTSEKSIVFLTVPFSTSLQCVLILVI